MRTLFHPALLHPATGDPGVCIDLPDEGRAVLVDLPSIAHLSPRKLLRLAHAVVTHTHEAAFLDADSALARERKHLTARQAGALARRAGAKRLAVFHVSPRYEGREAEVFLEAGEAFGAPVLEMA